MRTTTVSAYNEPPTTPAYSPSVPLSVYRELTTELQASAARVDLLTAKNQQLSQENQLLRQEITKVVQSLSHLQKLVDATNAIPHPQPEPRAVPQEKSRAKYPVNEAQPQPQSTRIPAKKSRREDFIHRSFPMPEPILIEEREVRYYPVNKPEVREISGWLLFLTIFLIMVTAFSAGYLLVRPLLTHQNN